MSITPPGAACVGAQTRHPKFLASFTFICKFAKTNLGVNSFILFYRIFLAPCMWLHIINMELKKPRNLKAIWTSKIRCMNRALTVGALTPPQSLFYVSFAMRADGS